MARSFIKPANLYFRQPRRAGFQKSELTPFDNSTTIGPSIYTGQIALRASLNTVVMMSFRPGGTDCGSTAQAAGRESGLEPQCNGQDEHDVMVKERVAVCKHFLGRVACDLDADMHSVIVAVSARYDPSIYLQQNLNRSPVSCIRGQSTDIGAGFID